MQQSFSVLFLYLMWILCHHVCSQTITEIVQWICEIEPCSDETECFETIGLPELPFEGSDKEIIPCATKEECHFYCCSFQTIQQDIVRVKSVCIQFHSCDHTPGSSSYVPTWCNNEATWTLMKPSIVNERGYTCHFGPRTNCHDRTRTVHASIPLCNFFE